MARFVFALVAALFAFAQPAAAQTFNAQQQSEIRAVVRDYLVRNPDVLQEALDTLASRKNAERVRRAEHDPRDFSIGPANAPITVVEFFDYRCPFCSAALPWVVETVNSRHDVRFVFKELPLPIHGPPTIEASRASIAAMPQGRYLQFHRAMLSFQGDLTSARIDQIARESGIDVARMRRNMNNPAVTSLLEDNRGLATDLSSADGVGTPTFLVNGRVVVGFRDSAELDQAIRQAAQQPRS